MSEDTVFENKNRLKNRGVNKALSFVGEVEEFTEILNDRRGHNKGEVALWRAVVAQALIDAGNRINKMEMKLEKARAITWLFGNSKDFNEVCIMAGVDPVMVRNKAKKTITEEKEMNKKCQTGKRLGKRRLKRFFNKKVDNKFVEAVPKFKNNVVSLFKK